MEKLYYTNLYKLYCYTHDITYNEKNIQHDSEFYCWLRELYTQKSNFQDYLGYLDLDIRPTTAIEIGKGASDSFGPENVTIVSKYGSTIPGQTSKSLSVFSDTPYIVSKNGIEYVDAGSLFLTHNPFLDAQDEILNLAKLHQSGSAVCIGMYGSIYEKNKQERIESLRKLSGRIGDSMGFYSDSYNGEYYACIKSEFKIKKLEKTR